MTPCNSHYPAQAADLSGTRPSSILRDLPMAKKLTVDLPDTTDRRIDALLTLLAENATIVISGAKIAKEIGVTRQQVWRWIEKLRELGVRVKGHPAHGLPHRARAGHSGAAAAEPSAVRHAFCAAHSPFFQNRFDEYGRDASGRTTASRTALWCWPKNRPPGAGAPDGPGSRKNPREFTARLLLRPPIPPAHAPLLTLVAGLAARDAAAEDLDTPRRTFAGRTICWWAGGNLRGILTEMHAEPDRMHYAVVGIGINVNQTKMPAELADIATSLRIETGKTHSRLELLIRLLRHLDRYYNQFLCDGAPPILRRFAEVSSYFRGKARAHHDGAESFTGTTAGLEPSGVLRVSRDDGRGIEPVLSGDVAEAD